MLHDRGAVVSHGFLPLAQNVMGAPLPDQGSGAPISANDLHVLQELLQPLFGEADCGLVARSLLEGFGSIGAVLAADAERLVGQVGRAAASHLRHLHVVLQHVLREQIKDRPLIGSWQALEEYLCAKLRHDTREKLLVLFLDRKNGLIRDEIMQQGTVDHVPTYPREIVKRALQLDASAIIMVHNHPSGDPTPSRMDVEMTKQVAAALASVDIALHDHAIVGRNKVVSLRGLRVI